MTAHIIFAGTPINNIVENITIKKTRDYNTSPYLDGSGSSTDFISELGRVISFKNICPAYEEIINSDTVENTSPVTVYKELADTYKNKTGVLTSESHVDLKGNYLCTDFEIVEDTGNNFTLTWEFTEVIPFNMVKKSFQVWGSASQSSNSNKQKTTAKTSGSKLNTQTKTLLKKCSTLSPSTKVRKCVKYLQKFMQSLGYYKKYKIDGIYGQYTKKELQKLQKSRKLKTTGKWDKTTLKYFQKKYKYP